jgi:glucokinase
VTAVVALDVGGTKAVVAAGDRDGHLIARRRLEMRTGAGVVGPAEVVATVEAFAREVAAIGVVGAAVGLAAALDPTRRAVSFAPNLPGWEGFSLAAALTEALGGVPVRLVYDGHAALLGEMRFGAGAGRRELAMLVIGTGIGGAIVSGGRLVEGADGLAGVAGYLPVWSEGRLMALEQAVSGPALARRASAIFGRDVDARGLLGLAEGGDRDALRLVDAALDELAVAVSALMSLLNPECVLLGGGVGEALAPWVPDLERRARALSQPTSARRARVAVGRLGADAVLMGALAAALDLVGPADGG